MKLQYHKSNFNKILTVFCVLFTGVFLLSSCSFNEKSDKNVSVQEPSFSMEKYSEPFLYDDIPTPQQGEVYKFTNTNDEEYDHYSFTFENFTLEDAKEYVALLEDTVVTKRVDYDVYTKNYYPILNYFGWLKDGSAVSLSQSDSSGGIIINIKKSD